MTRKYKTTIPTIILVASLVCGTIIYKNTHSNKNNSKSLLSYSKNDLKKASNELKQLNIRTYSDLEWGKDGRKKFFKGWQDSTKYNYNLPIKCKVNYAILILQSLSISYTDKCDIYYGKWKSPYTNKLIYTKSDIEIDHIVPLKNVWDSGANNWSQNKRIEYANTEYNLLISESVLNGNKGDKSPDKWMPPENKCGYTIKWINIKYTYRLSVTKQENVFLRTEISKCS